MKFRTKMMISMLCLLSFLFGVGGSALISISFQTALERETNSARESYQMLLDTLSVISDVELWTNRTDVSDTLDQLFTQSGSSWSALQLSTEAETLYQNGTATYYLEDVRSEIKPGYCRVANFTDSEGRHYLQLSGTFVFNNETLFLDAAQDISPIYEARMQQGDAYRIISLAVVIVCAILAYTISLFLTRPLTSLSRASREIALGHLSYRSEIRSNDEIGDLSTDFDLMANQVEKGITRMKESMEQQERFMGSFAHEIKTPMTSILGYADLLRTHELTAEEQKSAAHYIFSEGKRLESLSLKLLEIFAANKQDIELAVVSPAHLIADTIDHLQPTYEKEGITLSYSCEEDLCLLEPDLVRSLIINLVDNARKSLDGGSNHSSVGESEGLNNGGLSSGGAVSSKSGNRGGCITVVSKRISQGCRIQISDNGRGIPVGELEHLTEAFYRVDRARSRMQGGAGLGLTLCRKIAQLHQGTLKIESCVGLGTRVTVDLRADKV